MNGSLQLSITSELDQSKDPLCPFLPVHILTHVIKAGCSVSQ